MPANTLCRHSNSSDWQTLKTKRMRTEKRRRLIHDVFCNALHKVEAIDTHVACSATAVSLVNFITSVRILPPGETLSMKRLVLYGGGAVKFAPKKFHAVVLRFGDNSPAGNATALVFSTGKMVIVGAVNHEHARMASQQYRMFIEQIGDGALQGKTVFENFKMYNVVGKSQLGFRPNLKRLMQLYPAAAEWDPDFFPGLRLQVWSKPKSECQCPQRKHKQNSSCACNSTCLVFDTGNMVVTGVSTREMAIAVCTRVRLFFSDREELQDRTKELPRHLRFDHRCFQKLSDFEVDFISEYKTANAPPVESVDDVLGRVAVSSSTASMKGTGSKHAEDPIFDAIDQGQVDMVQFIVDINPGAAHAVDAQGRSASQRVADAQLPAHVVAQLTALLQ